MSSQNKQEKYSISHIKLSENGKQEDIYEHKDFQVDSVDIVEKIWNDSVQEIQTQLNHKMLDEKEFVMQEFQALVKEKIWIHKHFISNKDILNTKLSEILAQDLTSTGKVSKPFWTESCKEKSQKLWLPIEIDCVGLDTSLLNKYVNIMEQPSWFSIKELQVLKKDSAKTFSASSQSLAQECMALEVKSQKKKASLKKKVSPEEGMPTNEDNASTELKTLKFRIFPTAEQKEHLNKQFSQARWYYNSVIQLQEELLENKSEGKKYDSSSYMSLRNKLMKYRYSSPKEGEKYGTFEYNEEHKAFPVPEWWTNSSGKTEVASRVARGAVKKYSQNYKSARSNFKAGNCKTRPELKYISKKKDKHWILFEDNGGTTFLYKIPSKYWYRKWNSKKSKKKKRAFISLADVKDISKSLEVIYDRYTDKYFVHVSVPVDWFPADDQRKKINTKAPKSTVAIDPGVRKFATGFDGEGTCFQIGDKAQEELWKLMIEKDALLKNKRAQGVLQRRIQNLVTDLHWKTIKYLTDRYENILYPDFRISQMVTSRKLSSRTKRMLYVFCYHSFKEKLAWKSKLLNRKLYFVDEAYTSKTCTVCGTLNENGSRENLKCKTCLTQIDRDNAGARNIFLKYVNLK